VHAARQQQSAAEAARRVIVAAQEHRDQASADLATRRLDVHEKNAWMPQSRLE
jgi:starvation-inducible DNA-binding protein